MIVLVCMALAAALVGVVVYVWRRKRRRDTPEELRGEWWPHFEAEFREYVRRCERPGRGGRAPSSSQSRRKRDLAEGSA